MLEKKGFGGVGYLLDGGLGGVRKETATDFGEVGELLGAFGGVGEQRAQGGGYVGGGELLLDELGDDAAAGDEIDHGYGEVAVGVGLGGDFGWVADEAFGEGEGEGGDFVDDDEGVADDCGLDGGGAAGYDGGSGVVEGFAGVWDEMKIGRVGASPGGIYLRSCWLRM